MSKKEYIVTIVTHERHRIEVDFSTILNEEDVFEYLDDDTMIESEWVDVKDIDEKED